MAIAWRFSVVSPAFNEAASIARVVEKVAALPGTVEAIAVDDGSTDGTAAEIAGVPGCLPIVSLRLAGNRGNGAAVRAGIARATAPVVVLHDADLGYDPASLLGLAEPIERGVAGTFPRLDMCPGRLKNLTLGGRLSLSVPRLMSIPKWMVTALAGYGPYRSMANGG